MKNCLTTKMIVFFVVGVKKLMQLHKRNTFNAFPPVVKFSWLETDFSISTGLFGFRSSNTLEMNGKLHHLGHSQILICQHYLIIAYRFWMLGPVLVTLLWI